MSGLLGKVADQLSGQKPSQSSNGSSGLMHKMTDALTGQKHPQGSQNHPRMYGNNVVARPYASEGYQTGQYTRPGGQGHYEPHYEEGLGNYGAPNGGFGGHNNGPGFYPNESNHGYSSGHGGYGGPVGHEREYSSHQPGYVGHDASGGYSNQVEHGREYPQGGHNVPGRYDGHGEYRGENYGPVNYGGGHDERGGSHNNRGHGAYEGGHGQHGGAYRAGH